MGAAMQWRSKVTEAAAVAGGVGIWAGGVIGIAQGGDADGGVGR